MELFHDTSKRVAVFVLLLSNLFFFRPNDVFGTHNITGLGENEPINKLTLITGIVRNEFGVPLIGVSIQELGRDYEVKTDAAGRYKIQIHSTQAILIFKRDGYVEESFKTSGNKELNIRLSESDDKIKKSFPLGFNQTPLGKTEAFDHLPFKEINNFRQLADPAYLISSYNSSIQISSTDRPGEFSEIVGLRSSGALGWRPLVLLDNVPVDITNIDPNQIESVEVLKDASASALYGSRGSFGVILLTSKKPSTHQKLQINYSNQFSHSSPMALKESASLSEQVRYMSSKGRTHSPHGHDLQFWSNELDNFQMNPTAYPQSFINHAGLRYDLYNGKSQWEGLLGNSGQLNRHNLNANGGGTNNSYRISLSYLEEDGVLKGANDGYEQININSVFNSQIGKNIKSHLSLSYMKGDHKSPLIDLQEAFSFPAYNLAEGSSGNIPYYLPANVSQYEQPHTREQQQLRANAKIDVKIAKGLNLIGNFTSNRFSEASRKNRHKLNYVDALTNSSIINEGNGNYFKNEQITASFTQISSTLNWNKQIGLNFLRISSRYISERQNSKMESLSFSKGNGSNWEQAALGYSNSSALANMSYSFNNRFVLTAAARYDETHRFFTGQRNELSSNISGAWNISEEAFLKNQDIINLLKLRVSWGEVSEIQQDSWPSFSQMKYVGNSIQPYSVPQQPELFAHLFHHYQESWIDTETLNYGMDFAILKGSLSGSLNYLSRNTWYLALEQDIQHPVRAKLNTRGWELELSWIKDFNSGLHVNLGANVSNYRSTIINHDLEQDQRGSSLYLGQELGDIWGLYSDGYYQPEDFLNGSLDQNLDNGIPHGGLAIPREYSVRPGDSKYRDVNKDGQITYSINGANDLSIIGNSNPKYIFRAFATLNFEGLDLSMALSGVAKRDMLGTTVQGLVHPPHEGSLFAHQTDYWSLDNPEASFPRPALKGSNIAGYNYLPQSRDIYNGAYLKLDHVTVGYTFPSILTDHVIKRIRLYVGGENLALWDHLPEGWHSIQGSSSVFPLRTQLSAGLNLSL